MRGLKERVARRERGGRNVSEALGSVVSQKVVESVISGKGASITD